MQMKLQEEKVSHSLIERFRKYFEKVPNELTAKEAIEYALYCRALDGESVAAKEIRSKSLDKRVKNEDIDLNEMVKRMNEIGQETV